jgi:hypothetical protein
MYLLKLGLQSSKLYGTVVVKIWCRNFLHIPNNEQNVRTNVTKLIEWNMR